jgi:hypothetical protein
MAAIHDKIRAADYPIAPWAHIVGWTDDPWVDQPGMRADR